MNRNFLITLLIASITLSTGCWGKKLETGDPDIFTLMGLNFDSGPKVTSVYPMNGTQAAPLSIILQADFSTDMEPTSIDATTFTLYNNSTTSFVSGTVAYDIPTRRASFAPDNPLDDLTGYTAAISGAVTDLEGNTLGANYLWSFTTNQYYAGGDGTSANPFRVATPEQLYNVRYNLGAHFVQTADINLNVAPYNIGTGWEPIGDNTTPFTGTFSGGTRTIRNLFIDRPADDYIGLFGYTNGSVITEVRLDGVNVTGNNNVGSLIGYSSDTAQVVPWPSPSVDFCSAVNATVTGTANVGGLAGYNRGSISSSYRSLIENSYFIGTVIASGNYAGGLVGMNVYYGTISMCYSQASVTGNQYVGGLTGYSLYTAKIDNSYATGSVTATTTNAGGVSGVTETSTVSMCYSACTVTGTLPDTGGLIGSGGTATVSSYYNSDVSGLSDNDRGLPRTTAEMLLQSNYTGWDFTGIWTTSGGSYPYLRWQGSAHIPVP